MRCIWSTTAKVTQRHLAAPPICCSSLWAKSPRLFAVAADSAKHFAWTRRDARPFSAQANAKLSAPEAPSQPLSDLLTDAQISRAASHAVRLCVQNNELGNAYYVVNSLRRSHLPSTGATHSPPEIRGMRSLILDFHAMDFGRPISPRLSAHALLHALLRTGLTIKAADLADSLMKSNIRLRTATLQAILKSLPTKHPYSAAASQHFIRVFNSYYPARAFLLAPSMARDKTTQHAIRLLLQARRYRQRRTEDMYQSLISACLLQGEIIVGSLLFVIAVKDWQHRKAVRAWKKAQEQLAADGALQAVNDDSAKDIDLSQLESPRPSRFSLYSILSAIETGFSVNQRDEMSLVMLRVSLQALANLAQLLDNKELPFPEIGPLVRTLYKCPKVKDMVWIERDGKATQVDAYPYFHDVLKRLIDDLPTHRPSKFHGPMLPPLDLAGYNTLLHYALRHRFSPDLANTILEHMTEKRFKPFRPDTTTINILLRSGTLLQKASISSIALDMLRRKDGNMPFGSHGSDTVPDSKVNDSPLERSHEAKVSKKLSKIHTKPIQASAALATVSRPVTADAYTLVAYLADLTANGAPSAVANVIFSVLPELSVIDHPSWGTMTKRQRQALKKRSRVACLQRAVTYGPHVFSAFLNALRKAGKTGLAERVWLLAQEAEYASWDPEFVPGVVPWCLPVHAYTTMIQTYAAEARRGLDMYKGAAHVPNTPDLHGGWTPESNRYVRGWATYILKRREMEHDPRRHVSGRQLGLLLFRTMFSGARDVYSSLMRAGDAPRQPPASQTPKPDARFFNAALALFSRQPGMRARAPRAIRAHWRRHARMAHARFAHHGIVSRHWTPMLQQVVERMDEAGFAVPLGFRMQLIGRWAPTVSSSSASKELDQRPYAFPRVRTHRFFSHSIRIHKSRGLPVRRRRKRKA